MALSPETEARLLEAEAADYEAQADAREERAARWYGGGSPNFIRSLDTADDYRKRAGALRAQAAALRLQARLARTERKG